MPAFFPVEMLNSIFGFALGVFEIGLGALSILGGLIPGIIPPFPF